MLKHTSRQFKPRPTNQLRDNLPISCTLTLQPLDANPVFKKLPRTVMSLQLATYYYALQIGSRLVPEAERHQGALYTHDPSHLIAAMLAATEDGPKELQKICKDLPKDTVGLIEKLHHYHELMTDFTQAQVLENLSKGEWSLIQECITVGFPLRAYLFLRTGYIQTIFVEQQPHISQARNGKSKCQLTVIQTN